MQTKGVFSAPDQRLFLPVDLSCWTVHVFEGISNDTILRVLYPRLVWMRLYSEEAPYLNGEDA